MEISPAVLEFKGPFTKSSTEKLHLTNTSDKVLAFKVKTTAPKIYCVRPNASVIAPGESLDVAIISQGLKEKPSANFKCKDKFLVVTLPCPYDVAESGVAELWPKLEAQFKSQATNKKIRVNYLVAEYYASQGEPIPAPPAAGAVPDAAVPVAPVEGSQEPVVPATKVSKNSVTASGESRNEKSVSNNSTFDTPVPQTKENSEVTTTETETKGGFPIPLAILAIILAVLIGKYFL